MSETGNILVRECLVLFQEEPNELRQGYQTISDPLIATGFDFVTHETQVLRVRAAMEAAAREGRLGVFGRWNRTTGARGLIVGEGFAPRAPEIATVFAELLAEWPNEYTPAAAGLFNYLGRCASEHKLSVVTYAPEPGGGRVSYASAVKRSAGDGSIVDVNPLARLLLTERELSQWVEGRQPRAHWASQSAGATPPVN